MNRPNADELMGLALEASEFWGAIPIEERPSHGSIMARARSAEDDLSRALIELSKGDGKAARPWLLRAMYLIGGALSADMASARQMPEEMRKWRLYTQAEMDAMLDRIHTDIKTTAQIYHATRDEADANLRRAIAAERELEERNGQIERLLKKGGA